MKDGIGLFILILCCALLSVAGCGQKAVQEGAKPAISSDKPANTPGTVRIGLIAPLTGEFSIYGRNMERAFNLAIEEKNLKTGGFKIAFVIADDRGEAEGANDAAAKLITQEKVNAIVGSFTYNCNIPISDLAQSSKVPMITPASPMPGLTYHMGARKDYVYCAAFGDYFHGIAAAGFALENLNAKTAAILYDGDDQNSISLADHFKEKFESGGGKIESFEAYSRAGNDFSTKLTSMANQYPDVMYFPDAYDKAGRISSLAYARGIKATIYSGVVWDSDSIDRQAMEGAYCTEHYAADNPRPEVKEFFKKYYGKYNTRPDTFAALTYDATQMLLQAVELANSSDPAKIKEAVQNLKDFPAVTGKTTFDQDGSPVKPAVIIQIKGGKQVYVADAATI